MTDFVTPDVAAVITRLPQGAWAKPLAARKHHFFLDDHLYCLCRAYATYHVKPSEFGTAATDPRCPTCERKLGYWLKGES